MDGLAGLHYLIQGQWKHTLSIIEAHMAFYFKKNKQTKRSQSSAYPFFYANQKTILDKSVIAEYYLKGRKKFNQI